MHYNTILAFKRFCPSYFSKTSLVLEIGPDNFPSSFQNVHGINFKKWDTIDMYTSDKLTFQTKGDCTFPIENDTYDIVLAANVLEHVRKPWLWIKEVGRVCKENGVVICINPVSWHYHEAPIDCYRYYPEGMQSIFEEAKLDVLINQFGNFEFDLLKYKRTVQGVDKKYSAWKLKFMQLTGYPLEYASDIITIGRKK
jgi:SAM-dependent methyltransferase